MSKETEQRAALLGALFARMNPHVSLAQIAGDVAGLQTAARRLDALAVKACNVPLTARDEKAQGREADYIHTIAQSYRLEASVCGDPRGLVVKLWQLGEKDQDGAAGDAWGGGWGVY